MNAHHEKIEKIRKLTFLTGLSEEAVDLLAQNVEEVSFENGVDILLEGGEATKMYLIKDGNVEIGSEMGEQPRQRVQIVGPGDVLGWSWLFSPYIWSFSAKTLTPVRAYEFNGVAVRRYCDEHPKVGYELVLRFAKLMSMRLHEVNANIAEMSESRKLRVVGS